MEEGHAIYPVVTCAVSAVGLLTSQGHLCQGCGQELWTVAITGCTLILVCGAYPTRSGVMLALVVPGPYEV